MATHPIPMDDETQLIPLDAIRHILLEHTPPKERLAMMTQRMANDKKFDERATRVESDITSYGLGRA